MMSEQDNNIFKKFKSKKILIIGELIIDAYLQGNCSRIAPEASVPVIDILEKKYCLGGAANVAANLSALGAEVFFFSVCGDDDHGLLALELLANEGLRTEYIIKSKERTTLYKTRVSSDSQLLIRFDEGSIHPLCAGTQVLLANSLAQIYPEIEAVFIADYGKGVLGDAVISILTELNVIQPKIIALDTKHHQRYLALKPTVVKPNYTEAAALIKETGNLRPSAAELSSWGKTLYEKTAADFIFLTLDADGVCIFEKGNFKFHRPVPKVQNPKVSGAGDTFLATAMMGLTATTDLETIVDLSVAAAHYVVRQPHTSICSLNELEQEISGRGKLLTTQGINNLRIGLGKQWKKVVFTNGCFDILHSGHVSYLRGAKALGDILIVGLNTDESIGRLKGPERPINSLKDRIEVLSELSCIDYIMPFGKAGDDTPTALVQQIKPDVFVKGGDYQDKFLPEENALRTIGCEIVFLPMVADKSTTNTISKIKANTLASDQMVIN